MAGSSFNDFSSLKSLKKELEKNDVTAAPSKVQNEPRKKTVKLRSCFEMINLNSYASFPRIFRWFSVTMEPHCSFKPTKNPLENNL